MKLRHILSFFAILILMSSFASAGFFGTLLSIITGKSVADQGFAISFEPTLSLAGSGSCNGAEKAYLLKSLGSDLIEIADANLKVKEVYVTKGGCEGIYYKDPVTGNVASLKAIAADLIIGNRHYSLSIKSGIDLSALLGAGYSTIKTAVLTSDERTMQIGDEASKTNTIYLYEATTKSKLLYLNSEKNLIEAPSTEEAIKFDFSPTLVEKPKAEAPKAAEKQAQPAAWDEQRIGKIETQISALSGKVDQLTASVEKLGIKEPELQGQKLGFWSKVFRG